MPDIIWFWEQTSNKYNTVLNSSRKLKEIIIPSAKTIKLDSNESNPTQDYFMNRYENPQEKSLDFNVSSSYTIFET